MISWRFGREYFDVADFRLNSECIIFNIERCGGANAWVFEPSSNSGWFSHKVDTEPAHEWIRGERRHRQKVMNYLFVLYVLSSKLVSFVLKLEWLALVLYFSLRPHESSLNLCNLLLSYFFFLIKIILPHLYFFYGYFHKYHKKYVMWPQVIGIVS